MKTLLLFITLSAAAQATIIYIGSDALTTTNDSGHATVDLSGSLHPNAAWAPALAGSEWISYGPTGAHSDPGYFSPPNHTLVTFTTQFELSGAITGGTLTVMADDSTSVVLNGHLLFSADTHKGPRCSSQPIGCLISTEKTFASAALLPYLVDGSNTLSFGVVQVNGSSFGLDFAGSINDSPTPEPATLASIGCGLLGLAFFNRRK